MLFAPARPVARLVPQLMMRGAPPAAGGLTIASRQPQQLLAHQPRTLSRMMAITASEASELEEQIKFQGDKVRAAKEALKAGSGDKAAVDAEVAVLLDLKSKLTPAEAPAAKAKAPTRLSYSGAFCCVMCVV